MAATTRTRQLPGNREENLGEEPARPLTTPSPCPPASATHWEPGDAGPPRAEPLGTGGGSGAWALFGGSDETGQCLTPCHYHPPARGHTAHLWLWDSPASSELFSSSVVWGGRWAPGAKTEVAGSLVALEVVESVGLPSVPPCWTLLPPGAVSKEGAHSPGLPGQRPLKAVTSRSSRSAGTWAPHTPGPSESLLFTFGAG